MNITEYVNKNGIFDLNVKPLNPVDTLVLAQISYLKFEGLIPGPDENKEGVTFLDLQAKANPDVLFRDERYRTENSGLFEAVCKARRYNHAKLNNFIDEIDETINIQFSAMTVEFENGVNFVIFRGTDDNMVGWREDLNMTFMTQIPAQLEAVTYLEKVAKKLKGDFYIAGHSKGGNLSAYSATKCSDEVTKRIKHIYTLDGPGLSDELISQPEFEEVRDRITKYMPKSSIVGMFFTTAVECKYVDSKAKGMAQHFPFNWIVDDFDFKYVDNLEKNSTLRDKILKQTRREITEEQWRIISDNIFEVFKEAGVNNLNDFNDHKLQAISSVMNASEHLDDDSRELIKSAFAILTENATSIAKENALDEVNKAKEAAIIEIEKTVKKVSNNKAKKTKTKKKSKGKTIEKKNKA